MNLISRKYNHPEIELKTFIVPICSATGVDMMLVPESGGTLIRISQILKASTDCFVMKVLIVSLSLNMEKSDWVLFIFKTLQGHIIAHTPPQVQCPVVFMDTASF